MNTFEIISKIIPIILLIVVIYALFFNKPVEQVFTLQEFTDEDGWNYKWICGQYVFKAQEDAIKGWNCRLEQCVIKELAPLRSEECVCVQNDELVNRVCVSHQYVKTHDYPTYTLKEININKINTSEGEN